jgi:WD40 repeat protein
MNDQITAVSVSPDQKTLSTGSKDGFVSIWNIENNFEE